MALTTKKSAFIIGLVSASAFVSSFMISFSEMPNGVFIAGVNLSGLSTYEANTQLQIIDGEFQKSALVFSVKNHEPIIIERGHLGLSVNIDATIAKHAREISLFTKLFSQDAQAVELNSDVQPEFSVDADVLREKLRDVASYEKNPVDASLSFIDGKWHITAAETGTRLFPGELDRLKEEITNNPSVDAYQVQYLGLNPRVVEKDLVTARDELNDFIAHPIEIHHGEEVTTLTFDDHSLPLVVENNSVVFSADVLNAWISRYAADRDQDAGVITITGTEEFSSEYDHQTFNKAQFEGSFESGWKVNRDALQAGITSIIQSDADDRVVLVELDSVPPTIHSEVDGLTFPDLLSSGRSSFVDSNHPDRVTNISLSLGAMDMVVVQPGDTFSMGRTTGWITEDKGYTKTKVLYGGAVGLGVGGGVCQSSTTLYRAVLNGGFQVTERRPHTLDVSYYHKYGHGLDAAVFMAMERDFKFNNDSGHPILVHTYVTPYDEAVVEIYGTSDGRAVELTNIPTGVRRHKQWEWLITWPDHQERRIVDTWYTK